MQHRRSFITKSACQSNWTAHACIPLASPDYLTLNTLRIRDNKSRCSFAHTASVDCYFWHFLICGSFSRAVPLTLCLSSWAQKMQLLSLSRGTEGGGYSEVPNFALWPLFASFSRFLFDFKRAVYPPQRATFHTAVSHTVGRRVFWAHLLATDKSFRRKRASLCLSQTWFAQYCKSLAFRWNAFKWVKWRWILPKHAQVISLQDKKKIQ